MVRELDLTMADGRQVHVYDAAPDQPAPGRPTVFWHHGTPQTGRLPDPLLSALARYGVRFISHDRPGYGSSTPQNGRDVAAVAADVAAIAAALEIERFAVLGLSGGGPHALACAALHPDRVWGVACLAGVAPYDAEGLDWYDGMAASGVQEFTAAARSRSALVRHLSRSSPDDLSEFAPADMSAFAGPYGGWLVESATDGLARGYEGAVEDDQAFVHAWGFDPAAITAPLLLVHGDADRFVPASHARWLASHCPTSELRVTPEDGHISILDRGEETVDWLLGHAAPE